MILARPGHREKCLQINSKVQIRRRLAHLALDEVCVSMASSSSAIVALRQRRCSLDPHHEITINIDMAGIRKVGP